MPGELWSDKQARIIDKRSPQIVSVVQPINEIRLPIGTGINLHRVALKDLRAEVVKDLKLPESVGTVLEMSESPLLEAARDLKLKIETLADKVVAAQERSLVACYQGAVEDCKRDLAKRLFKDPEAKGLGLDTLRSHRERVSSWSKWRTEFISKNGVSNAQISAYSSSAAEWTVDNAHTNLVLECLTEFDRLKEIYEKADSRLTKEAIANLSKFMTQLGHVSVSITPESIASVVDSLSKEVRNVTVYPLIERLDCVSIDGRLLSIKDLDKLFYQAFSRLRNRLGEGDSACQEQLPKFEAIKAGLRTLILNELFSGRHLDQVQGLLGAQTE